MLYIPQKSIIPKILLFTVLFLFFSSMVYASGTNDDKSLGDLADIMIGNLDPIVRLLSGLSYVIGIGFALVALLKFKQHKDNPQQTPLSNPVLMIFIAAAMIWLPQTFGAVATSVFGTTDGATGSGGFTNPWTRVTEDPTYVPPTTNNY